MRRKQQSSRGLLKRKSITNRRKKKIILRMQKWVMKKPILTRKRTVPRTPEEGDEEINPPKEEDGPEDAREGCRVTKGKRVTYIHDSFYPQATAESSSSIKTKDEMNGEDSGQKSCTTKELKESGEVNIAQKSRSTEELDKLGERDTIEGPDGAETRQDKIGVDSEEEVKLSRE